MKLRILTGSFSEFDGDFGGGRGGGGIRGGSRSGASGASGGSRSTRVGVDEDDVNGAHRGLNGDVNGVVDGGIGEAISVPIGNDSSFRTSNRAVNNNLPPSSEADRPHFVVI